MRNYDFTALKEVLDNPRTVVWSHSNRQSDFYELPTDGAQMYEALEWLLRYYGSVKLWMGLESGAGAELYLTCSPSQRTAVVDRLALYEEDTDFSRSAELVSKD